MRKRRTREHVIADLSVNHVERLVLRCGWTVERTSLFSLRENAIAKEPGLRYPERWPCVSRLGCSNGGSASFEASP
jgi:hypothetical protein